MQKKPLLTELRSSRLVLRKHALEIAPAMFECVNADRARLREFLPWVDPTKTVVDTAIYITMTLEKWESCELFDYGIYLQPDEALRLHHSPEGDAVFLGNIGVHLMDWENEIGEIGYWILGKFEGQGYMSEAVQTLENALFASGFKRLEIRCSARNERSARIPRRSGYELEGTFKSHKYENGERRDTLIFAKLAR